MIVNPDWDVGVALFPLIIYLVYLWEVWKVKKDEIEVGQKVTYVTPYKKEKGIVKSLSSEGYAFVVYHCGGDWEHYSSYTGARTRIEDLEKGWK